MTDVTLLELEVMQRVVRTGSFSSAADDLGYTQSAVSRQIGQLEQAVGERLFVRGRRGVVLTVAGQILLVHAEAALAEIDTARSRLARLRDRLAGRLVIGAFPTAAAVLVPRAVAAVLTEHPGLRIDVDEAPTPTLLRRLRAGRLDVAVVGVGAGLPAYELADLRQHVLAPDDLLVAVSTDHRLARRNLVTPDDLAEESWIVGPTTAGEPHFGAWPTLSDPRIGYTVRDWPARLGPVASGLGVTSIPGIAAASVPAGVTTLRVTDPLWAGRRSVVVTAHDAGAPTQTLVGALCAMADRIAHH